LPGFSDKLLPFDPRLLGYPWRHADPRVDALHQDVQALVLDMENASRTDVFGAIWQLAHRAAGRRAPSLDDADPGVAIPHLSEPWYCCAEPTEQQLESF
jgi:hypothetical protein